jgi:rSAM/selenodomain-associated transferase 1
MDRVALFAKWPAPGRVKTRLSPALPPALAHDLYRAMLEDALGTAAGARAGERFVYWADAPQPRGGVSVPGSIAERDQEGADLGERIEHAFGELLRASGDRAVIVGADCPALDASTITASFEALATHDAVLGPARDGGYYLVGLARPAPALFRGIEWGSGRVLEQTLERARAAGLTVARLETLDDLDTPADLARWLARSVVEGAESRSRAAEALRAMGLLPGG